MNPLQQFISNPQMFQKQLNDFAQNVQRNFGNADPKQIVQNLLNSGQMTQSQFNRFSNIANQIAGKRF